MRSTYRRYRFWQNNHLIRWSSFWSWREWKQAKLSHLGHRIPARIHWKVDAPKTIHCSVRILVQRHNWAIFLRKWARRCVTVNGDRYRANLNEFLFTKIEEENIGNIWFQQDGATVFATCVWRSHYQPQIWCYLATSELRFDTVGLLLVRCCQK